MIRATVGGAGLAGLAYAAVFSPEFVETYIKLKPLLPDQHAIVVGVRWAALAVGMLLVALAAALPAVIGRRRYNRLSGTHLAKFGLFLAPLVATVLLLAVKLALGRGPWHWRVTAEGHVVESLTSVAYLLAAALAVAAAVGFIRARERLPGYLYLLLALSCLLVSLEEISWGQRMFGMETPEWFQEHNAQDEFTLHNLEPVHRGLHQFYIVVGLYGALAWLIPLCLGGGRLGRLASLVAPQWFVASYFAVAAVFHILNEYTTGWGLIWGRDMEFAELLLSIGFLLFVLTVYREQREALRPS